jgi:ABC-type polysaccharide/polyol phosphate transport system ATPase subunit
MTVVSSSSSKKPRPAPRREQDLPAAAQAQRSGQPLIELRDLGVWFRLHARKKASLKRLLLRGGKAAKPSVLWALRNINLTCHEGEALGIVGPNGAGKSTLCLILAQILTPDEGHARIAGKVSTLLTLGAGFNRDLSGRANILLYAAFLGIPRADLDAKMQAIIEFSELGAFIEEPVRTYSNGMRARLAFSVAATLDPEILILDEVLAVGDRQFRAKSQARMMELIAQSKLIVIVSHATQFLRQICTHCLWLERGEAKMYGQAGEVLDAYEQATGGAGAELTPDVDDPLGDV